MKYKLFKNLKVLLVAVMLVMTGLLAYSFTKDFYSKESIYKDIPVKDSIASVKAFKGVYSVLMHPRCMNCHPSGDVPLQGDDSHVHSMLPKRGKDGKGLFAMKCANCHQLDNTAGVHTPPGNPNWHLPPANMKMVFQGRTPRQLAMQLLDPKQNGG